MKNSFRYIQYTLVALLIFLTGCSYPKDTDEIIYYYNGNPYTYAEYWKMINSEDYIVGTVTWEIVNNQGDIIDKTKAGKENKFHVYSDPQTRFIFDNYFQLLYHKTNDPLPNFKDAERIEKIRFNFNTKRKSLTIDDKSFIKEIVALMSQPYQAEEFNNNSPSVGYAASLDIFFKDYPAYYTGVSIIEAKDGSYGIFMDDWQDTIKVRKCDYIKIPKNSQINRLFD